MNNYPSKGNVKFTHYDGATISSEQLVDHLCNEVLGFQVTDAEFLTLHGVNGTGCSVILSVAISAEDIVKKSANTDYFTDFLAKNSTGTDFDQEVIKALEPFMFPSKEGWQKLLSNPEKVNDLASVGLVGENLQFVANFSRFRRSDTYGQYVIVLNTETLIRDYLADPATGLVDGTLSIESVNGEKSPGITWDVIIKRDKTRTSINDVSMEAIFATVR